MVGRPRLAINYSTTLERNVVVSFGELHHTGRRGQLREPSKDPMSFEIAEGSRQRALQTVNLSIRSSECYMRGLAFPWNSPKDEVL